MTSHPFMKLQSSEGLPKTDRTTFEKSDSQDPYFVDYTVHMAFHPLTSNFEALNIIT